MFSQRNSNQGPDIAAAYSLGKVGPYVSGGPSISEHYRANSTIADQTRKDNEDKCLMITEEQGKQELELLRDYLQKQRKLDVRDAVIIMLNCLNWFGVNPIQVADELKDFQRQRDNMRRMA